MRGAIKREALADATYGGDDNGDKERLDQWLNVSGMIREPRMRRSGSAAALFVCVVFDRAICYKSAVALVKSADYTSVSSSLTEEEIMVEDEVP